MNELSLKFLKVNDGDTVILEKGKIYDVRQDDSVILENYFCTNTADRAENPKGLRNVSIYLKDKKNITIDGNGAMLLIHGKMTPFLFDRCENITVKNLTVDYACPTMTEVKVLSNNDGVCELEVNDDCIFTVEDNDIIFLGENGSKGEPYWQCRYSTQRHMVKVYDPETQRCRDFDRNDFSFEGVERISQTKVKVKLKNKNADFETGCVFQMRNIVRDQTGALFERCKNLNFENLRIMFMHGLGMVSQFCENIFYKNCDFTPKTGRTVASTADFFQFSGCRGNLIIDSCRAGGAHDDYVNVHGTHLRIIEKNDEENSMILRFMHNETWGIQAFDVDDELEFIKWDTLIPYAQTRVTDFKKLNDTDIKIYTDRPLPKIEVDKDVVENATWTPDLHIKNCSFGPTAGRGVLCTTRGKVVIENNVFNKLWGPALLVEDDCNFWFESGYTNEIIFKDNRVTACDYANTYENSPVIRYTPKVMDENSKQFVHGKLSLLNNRFENAQNGKHGIWLEYLREAEIVGNEFDAPYIICTKCVGKIDDRENNLKEQ